MFGNLGGQAVIKAVMPLAGEKFGLYPTLNLGVQLTLLQQGGHIIHCKPTWI
jgi:hypothetical protein